jgi:SHS2 domain-containing protein
VLLLATLACLRVFAQAVVAMFGYMTDLEKVEEDEACTQEFEVEGHDMLSLLCVASIHLLFNAYSSQASAMLIGCS